MPPNTTPNAQPNPNQLPQVPTGPEHTPLTSPEQSPAPVAPEAAPSAPSNQSAGPQPLPVLPPQPQVIAPVTLPATPPPPTPTPTIGPSPATAGDVDVIEKEWVDQADKIIAQTKGDPYVEEEAEEALQQDYLKKRYGHDVKKPDAT